MTAISITLPDDKATQALGRRLARVVKRGDFLAVFGDLGAGKTTLARGLIHHLAGREIDVPSPTYTLVQTYELPDITFWHFDLYRLKSPDDIFELGWEDCADGVAFVEWPGQAGPHLPKWRLDITLETSGDGRIARLEPHGEDWQTCLDGF